MTPAEAARLTLAPAEGAPSSARAPFPRTLGLRCADVHPVDCDAAWRSLSPEQLVASASEHGARIHGFTPAWYSEERLAAMAGAVSDA